MYTHAVPAPLYHARAHASHIAFPNKLSLPTFVCDSAKVCAKHCVSDPNCGAVTYMTPYEPLPVPRPGCASQRPGIDGCCFPTRVQPAYDIVPPGQPATYGFVSAILRTSQAPAPAPAPAPPRWVPADWTPTYEMHKSISVYWRNHTGIEPAYFYDGVGLVMLDWAHAAQEWINGVQPMDNGAGLARQCTAIKARNPHIKCNVYRNTVIALNQFRHISKLVDDPQFSGYFLRFKPNATQSGRCWGQFDPRAGPGTGENSRLDPIWPQPVVCEVLQPSDVHVPLCDKADPTKCNTDLYFDQNQCPQVPGDNWSNDTDAVYQGLVCEGRSCNCGLSPCGEYLFDFTNASMVDWWLREHMGGDSALGHPDVDGLILDDYWQGGRPSEIDAHSLEDMGLTAAQVAAQQAGYTAAMSRLYEYIADKDKFLAGGRDCGYSGDSMSTQSSASCTRKLSAMCSDTSPAFGQWYVVQYAYVPPPSYGITAPNPTLDVAYFLLTRAPFAWIAGGPMLGWHMSHWWTTGQSRRIHFRTDLRPPEFEEDYGVPTNNCTQSAPGVFTRAWSKALVEVDCNTLEGRINKLV